MQELWLVVASQATCALCLLIHYICFRLGLLRVDSRHVLYYLKLEPCRDRVHWAHFSVSQILHEYFDVMQGQTVFLVLTCSSYMYVVPDCLPLPFFFGALRVSLRPNLCMLTSWSDWGACLEALYCFCVRSTRFERVKQRSNNT